MHRRAATPNVAGMPSFLARAVFAWLAVFTGMTAAAEAPAHGEPRVGRHDEPGRESAQEHHQEEDPQVGGHGVASLVAHPPHRLDVDEAGLPGLITSRTRCIVVVHYAGVGCEMDAILDIASKHGLAVIEDNAHGLYASWHGQPLGSFGRFATQSFHETKNFVCGEGGALLLNDGTGRFTDITEVGRELDRLYYPVPGEARYGDLILFVKPGGIVVLDEATLRRIAWVEGNRRKVDELTGGRVAYVYLPNTSAEGTSTLTLSVSRLAIGSSWATDSPGFLSHWASVPSVIDSPSAGTLTSAMIVLRFRRSRRFRNRLRTGSGHEPRIGGVGGGRCFDCRGDLVGLVPP